MLVLCVAFAACRTTTPGVETPVSLMRIRATSGEKTQSFRARLHATDDAMLLTAYTPLGTSAFRLYASGDRVVFLNDVDDTRWSGTPAEFARSFAFFGDATPVTMAQLILGRRGSERTQLGDVTITYDPPKRVTIARGAQRLEIEHLESDTTTAPLEEPKAPRNYRCCVPPRL